MRDNNDKYSICSKIVVFVAAAAGMSLSGACGPPCPLFECFPFGECWPLDNPNGRVELKGILLDSVSLEGLSGVDVDADLLTSGERTTREPHPYPTAADGSFYINLSTEGAACQSPPDLPAPDQVRVIVPLEGCTRNFTFDVNEENFVDPEFNDRVLELKNPILVPACEE